MRKAIFAVDELRLVARSGRPDTFAVGDRVRLNSGGPIGLVVDLDSDQGTTVAWKGQRIILESTLPRVCLTRAQP